MAAIDQQRLSPAIQWLVYSLSTFEGIIGLTIITLLITICYYTTTAIRRVYFHPLSSFPGPKLAAASSLVHVYHSVTGNLSRWIESLHREYGDTVRTKPNELSFINEAAWKDIYQHRPQMSKEIYIDPVNGVHSLLTADDENHTRMRRILAFAFSEKALREQESILRDYADLLIQKLREESQGRRLVDIVNWYNYTTFDIIGDLCFGESFHNLDNKGEHPWISGVLKAVKMGMLHAQTRVIPPLNFIVKRAMPIYLKGARSRIFGFTQERVEKRLMQEMQRPDFMTYVLKAEGTEKGLSRPEMDTNFLMLTNAGSETTATTLSACTYYLLRNPHVLRRLKEEIRGSFQSEKDITVTAANKLPYLTAVLTETLRIHAPAPISFPRFVTPEGAIINGRWVPGGVVVGIPHRAAYQSEFNFVEPLQFIPERWLEKHDPKFDRDRRGVLQPFSAGPRACLGKNLAYAELRLIMSRMIWNFDIDLVNDDGNWPNQKVYVLYQKKPMMIRLNPRKL